MMDASAHAIGQESVTIPTEMFTRQIRQNLKSVTVKITNAPKNPFDF